MSNLARRSSAIVETFKSRLSRQNISEVPTEILRPIARFSTDVAFRMNAATRMESLTSRQVEVLDHLLTGASSKVIAFRLGVSSRTIEHHRMKIARRFGAKTLVELVHAATCARCNVSSAPIVAPAPVCPKCALKQTFKNRPRELPASCIGAEAMSAARIAARETQHRMKNMATVMVSMCSQVARDSETKQEFEQSFSDRVTAYCRSLDLMVENDWKPTDLRSVVALQLGIFGGIDGDRISAAGPALEIPPVAVQNIGLALHELATNAVKYGALSTSTGKVCVSWSTSDDDQQRLVRLTWEETGGPAVEPRDRKSFGSLLLSRIVASALDGTSRYELAPAGVVWTLTFPIPQ